MLGGLHNEWQTKTPPEIHNVLSIKVSFLTISFDDTIAVVANISKQLTRERR